MTVLRPVASALPKYHASNQDILDAAKIWLSGDDAAFSLFERFLSSSQTNLRHFIMPARDIISLGGAAARSRLFEQHAPALAFEAARQAIEHSGLKPEDIEALIFTSCSCPMIPSVDTYLVDHLGLRRDILRLPSYQFGCAGGVIALGLAKRLTPALSNILLVNTELCSLVFQPKMQTASDLVAAAIFGDGAAASVITSDESPGSLTIEAHQSYLLPETRHLMGYDIEDFGSHLRLDKELPSHLVEVVPKLVERFLASHHLSRKDIPWYLFHPGGAKILASLQEVLELAPQQCHWSGEVLRDIGNLSSATILHVVKLFTESHEAQSGERALIVGVGPGLTIELVLAKVC